MIDPLIINIKKAFTALSNKEADVALIYRGPSYGNVPWLVRCDSYDGQGYNSELAAEALFDKLKKELEKKLISMHTQAKQFENALKEINLVK